MYNLATAAPPETITVNGGAYSVNTDYRIWIEIMDVFMFKSDDLNALLGCIQTAFCDPNDVLSHEDISSIIEAMCTFLLGYPKEKYDDDDGECESQSDDDDDDNINQERYFDFKYDLNWIIIAIRNQSGIDLSYKCEHFHWWLFLLEFESLEDHHYFSRLRNIREYNGDDKEMLAQKARFALPVRRTAEQRKEIEEFDKIFYNS